MQVIFRALAILQCVSTAPAPPTLNEISQRLDIPAPTAHRILAALVKEDYVSRDPLTKRYSPSSGLMAIFPGPRTSELSAAGAPITQALASRFDETAYVAEFSGEHAICVARVESKRPLRLNMKIAAQLPWHASAGARSILAFLSSEEARRLIESQPLEKYTKNTPGSVDLILEHLAQVREQGYDICDDELDRGVWAAAAPVFGPSGVVGSVGVGGVATRLLDPSTRMQVIESVIEAGNSITAEMGGASPAQR